MRRGNCPGGDAAHLSGLRVISNLWPGSLAKRSAKPGRSHSNATLRHIPRVAA
ncbi:hypothetical protein [Klebsiella pasteurii]|uniref:hypothetical protein n=1 Tax=Klebsiella pasteurii TaxID=2587529 RepID=UPI00163BC055|nr:hypothetical protein [Klebsiella pasteurii]